MLFIFQILFTLFIFVAIATVYKRRSQTLLGPKGSAFWVLFWIGTGLLGWWPESSSKLAELVGIGRGVDLVIYVSIAMLFFLLFRLHIKIESIARSITKMTREQALMKEHKNKK